MSDEIEQPEPEGDDLPQIGDAKKATLHGIMAKVKAGKSLKRWESQMLEEWEGSSQVKDGLEALATKRDKYLKKKNELGKKARDIAEVVDAKPDCKDPARHESCRLNLKLFCETYFPFQFHLKWSEDHLKVLAKTEQAILNGGLFALAMSRGSGKSTIAECATLWAILYAHRDFVVFISSDHGLAAQGLDSLKTELESNTILLEDFRHAISPIVELEGIAHRSIGQLYRGARTLIGWTSDELIMPTIPGLACSGAIIKTCGITGSIRGMKHKTSDGKSRRPSLVIVDDCQTDESARSVSQSQARVAVLSGAVLGLAGPGKKIAGIMPCTVIRPGDMADQILDQRRHPEWNGERMKMVYEWPTNAKLWEEYGKIRGDSLRLYGTIEAATEFYRANRAAMDAGARVAWAERFNSDEISALQNAMNLRFLDEAAFFAEYQNEPLSERDSTEEDLTTDLIVSRLNGLQKGALSTAASRVTAFIDVQQSALWYVVCAWTDSCDGTVLDYGTWPDQNRAYFTLKDTKQTLAHAIKGAGLEAQIYGGLEALTKELFARAFKTPNGAEAKVERLLIDANWGQSTNVVYQFCKESPFSAMIFPSHGRYVGASSRPMNDWDKKPGERTGQCWRSSIARRGLRSIGYDTNFWKSWIAARFLTMPGDPGSLTAWGKDPERHRMWADHMTSEHRVRTTGRGRTCDEWHLKPGRDNHWWDGIVASAVAASIQGMPASPPGRAAIGPAPVMPNKVENMSFAALQRAARQKKRIA